MQSLTGVALQQKKIICGQFTGYERTAVNAVRRAVCGFRRTTRVLHLAALARVRISQLQPLAHFSWRACR
jgi:hypothetical protein